MFLTIHESWKKGAYVFDAHLPKGWPTTSLVTPEVTPATNPWNFFWLALFSFGESVGTGLRVVAGVEEMETLMLDCTG